MGRFGQKKSPGEPGDFIHEDYDFIRLIQRILENPGFSTRPGCLYH